MGEKSSLKRLRRITSKAKELFKKSIIYYRAAKIKNFFSYYYYKIFKSSRNFVFQGKYYIYFYHKHNLTWTNERAVEIPIMWNIVKKHNKKNILEVGNVLSHYFPVSHDILDKYEKAEGVINQDVIDFQPSKKYDLIISISTLEHVGWDETTRDPTKILRAIQNLKNLLASGGQLIVTLPLGYNLEIDHLLEKGKIRFTQQHYLKRVSKDNRWVQVDWGKIRGVKYGSPFPAANAIVIGIIEKKRGLPKYKLYKH